MKSDSVFVEVRGDQLVRVQHGEVIGVLRDLPPRSTSTVRELTGRPAPFSFRAKTGCQERGRAAR
jgi:hypothetical protein